ncbi:2OG-Fe(II) oxygenase [Oleiagrimonas soli]|uniref:Proline dioxygenase n=1 Tax=Oleiagrimonas soli TaxID=1543381 RepID=A0A099CSA6_9GAMM|nr:2OG-Fe(II) oxygenase [Oleiagrimonas soli]KGI76659.1 proline dioxygenase [Oleiagrimonas soli]MBB6185131.1 prolyl 4-hydroxylase [Oleiagrimonas soli]
MSKHDESLRDWILTSSRAGHDIETILLMMLRAGYESRQARQILAKTLKRPALALDVEVKRPPGKRTRHPEPPEQVAEGHAIAISMCIDKPPIRILEHLLRDDECDELIELAKPRLDRSLTVSQDGGNQVDEARTSSGMFFKPGETPLIERIDARIAALTGLPTDHGEALQVLHYLPGQKYEPHFDWFDSTKEGFRLVTHKGGQRVATIIMYLNTPTGGGGTHFPNVGVTVTARRGSALYFAYEQDDKESLHAGLPVTEGEKWIATKWIREHPFK